VLNRITDAECREGPSAAAARIFAEYGDFIRTVLYFRVRNLARVEDLFQELFLKFVEQPIPADVVNIKGYLYQTIVNDTVDLMRRQEKYRRHMRKYAEEVRISIHKRPSQDAIEETEERSSRFAYLVRQLRRREAQVVTLRYRDNCTIAEIAQKMGVHKRTVSRYLTSGMRELRRMLAIE
jgi:RNA polymerase sigma factor (sigma-70 family)